jgi:hypothetical protein
MSSYLDRSIMEHMMKRKGGQLYKSTLITNYNAKGAQIYLLSVWANLLGFVLH